MGENPDCKYTWEWVNGVNYIVWNFVDIGNNAQIQEADRRSKLKDALAASHSNIVMFYIRTSKSSAMLKYSVSELVQHNARGYEIPD